MTESELLDITFHSCPSRLSEIRAEVRRLTEELGFSTALVQQLALVLDEAISNVIRHAYGGRSDGTIRLKVACQGDELVFKLRDYADEVDANCIKPRDLGDCRPGGLGINFIDSVMDSWQFCRPPSGPGNLLVMTKQVSQCTDRTNNERM